MVYIHLYKTNVNGPAATLRRYGGVVCSRVDGEAATPRLAKRRGDTPPKHGCRPA